MVLQAFVRRALTARPVLTARVPTSFARCQSSDAKAQKEAQLDRTKIDRQANEYNKTGTDDAASNQDAAFDPNSSNDPEKAMQEAGQSDGKSDVSPADPSVSSGTKEVSPGVDQKLSEGGGGRSGGGDSTGNKSRGSSV